MPLTGNSSFPYKNHQQDINKISTTHQQETDTKYDYPKILQHLHEDKLMKFGTPYISGSFRVIKSQATCDTDASKL